MESDSLIERRLKQIDVLKSHLKYIDKKLMSIAQGFNWDYAKLQEEGPSDMVICSVNNQHRVPKSKLSSHEEKCRRRQEGYRDDDKFFPDHSGSGSFVTLTSDLLKSITANVSPAPEQEPPLRSVPQTSANLDQNFSREEKLAIYDYVIANTEKQNAFSDLCFQSIGKKDGEGKKELAPWEIAAAERDAKRRRASYRRKVHTNHKSQTEILREVIEIQMEILKDEIAGSGLSITEKSEKEEKDSYIRSRRDSRCSEEDLKYSNRETSSRQHRDDHHKSRSHDRHSRYRDDRKRRRSPSYTGSDSDSRSRSRDRFRKRNPYDGRSHSHKSRHYSRREEYRERAASRSENQSDSERTKTTESYKERKHKK